MTLENCVEAITQAILRQEGGSNPKSVHAAMVARFGLHNPGHLIWARQRGAQPVQLSPQGRLWAGWKTYAEGVEGVLGNELPHRARHRLYARLGLAPGPVELHGELHYVRRQYREGWQL